MMIHTDPTQTQAGALNFVDQSGAEVDTEDAVIITVVVSDQAALLSAYNATDPMSPSEPVCRTVVCAVFDALVAHAS
jgi:hypothetical protein